MKTNANIKSYLYALGVLLLCFGFTATAQNEATATLEYPTAETDLLTAKATVKAYEEGNWEELRSHLKKDAKIYGLGNFESLNVDQTVDYWTKGRTTATPTLAEEGTWIGVSFPDGPQKGNWVYHWGVNTLNYKNGETISFPFHVTMRMEDNKVAESHFYYDNSKIIRAMGYAISPPLQETEEEIELELELEN